MDKNKYVKLSAIERIAKPMSAFHEQDEEMDEEYEDTESEESYESDEMIECPKCGHSYKAEK
jgi:hypothetical protein